MATSTSGAMASGTMTMAMSSSTSTMDSMDMAMNSYLTHHFNNYPVVFQHLRAHNKRQAFGIFVLIVAVAFVYKFLLFTSWCLEVRWFKKWNSKSAIISPVRLESKGDDTSSTASTAREGADYIHDLEFQSQFLPKLPNLLLDFMSPTTYDLLQDFVRLLLAFASTMFIYILMLVTMSFILTYFFAVVLGLSLAEIFFNRWKICLLKRWELQREIERRKNCPGGGNCYCGSHKEETTTAGPRNSQDLTASNACCAQKVSPVAVADTDVAKQEFLDKESTEAGCCCASVKSADEEPNCCCDVNSIDEEEKVEKEVREISKQREQAGNMDVDLMPADKFM